LRGHGRKNELSKYWKFNKGEGPCPVIAGGGKEVEKVTSRSNASRMGVGKGEGKKG